MSKRYKIFDTAGTLLLSPLLIAWMFFTRNEYRTIVVDIVKYSIKKVGLIIFIGNHDTSVEQRFATDALAFSWNSTVNYSRGKGQIDVILLWCVRK